MYFEIRPEVERARAKQPSDRLNPEKDNKPSDRPHRSPQSRLSTPWCLELFEEDLPHYLRNGDIMQVYYGLSSCEPKTRHMVSGLHNNIIDLFFLVIHQGAELFEGELGQQCKVFCQNALKIKN